MFKRKTVATTFVAASALFAGGAQAATIEIEVTHNGHPLFITPLYSAFQSSAFDAFNVGEDASAGVEAVAETGAAMPLAAERNAVDPTSVATTVGSPPEFLGGGSATSTLEVDLSVNDQFSFLAMVLPSNDIFIGSDDAYSLSDLINSGTQTIDVNLSHFYDAGTEQNNLTQGTFIGGTGPGSISGSGGAAFVLNNNILEGEETDQVIRAVDEDLDLINYLGGAFLAAPPDPTNQLGQIPFPLNFASFDTDPFLTITLTDTSVAPVPLPAGMSLMMLGLGALGIARQRQKK